MTKPVDRLAGILAWVASSNKSTAHHSIKDDGLLYCAELLSIIAASDKELEQVKADHAELVRACISDRVLTHDDSCGFNEYQWCDCAAGKASEKRIQAALANLQGSNKA